MNEYTILSTHAHSRLLAIRFFLNVFRYANRIYFSGQFVLNLPGDAEPTGCSLISSISIERWGTDAPTLAPSTSPTGWFEAAGHPENITELQGQTQDLATTVSALGVRQL